MHYIYFLLLAFTISYPLLRSFENKISYYKKWKFLFPSILISAVIFISWDIWFTRIGVWSFNPDFVIGLFILNLPIEEWIFFFIIPFSCVFIYEVLNYFVKRDLFANYSKMITIILIGVLLMTAGLNIHRLHTSITFISLAFLLILHQFIFKSNYLGKFYLTWLVCFIPFLLVNGILTAMPVLIYRNPDILNVRIYTIPVEDVFYGMLQILLVITVYEYLKRKRV
jgi:lycopene cyclase domain-containing protein